jgi:tetratricopeptide (TPR) repeat protein
MGRSEELDFAGSAGGCRLVPPPLSHLRSRLKTHAIPIALLLLLCNAASVVCRVAMAQDFASDAERQAAAQKAVDAGQWAAAARIAKGPANQPADLDFIEGLALARLQRWSDARAAFAAGRAKSPRDPRFLVELGGVSYRQKGIASAKRELRDALRLDQKDRYTLDFLGTLYFLDGNLEAALKYWNRIDKPRLRSVAVQPEPRVDRALLQRAIGFNAPQVLTGDALLAANARLDNLGIFAQKRTELAPAAASATSPSSGDGNFDATLHLAERDGFGSPWWAGALSLLSGVAYATTYPEFYDLGHRAVNVTSLLRWDSQKRRAFAAVAMPLRGEPKYRLQFYFDGRNENWNLANTFFGGGALVTNLNVRRVAGGAELHAVMNGLWSWSTGVELASRSFRNLEGHTSASESPFFRDGESLVYWARADRSLWRVPERRFTVDGEAEARLGREFADNLGAFGGLRGTLKAHWFPQARGDDYEMQSQLRAGELQGNTPFDELFQLGIERDNDLWLRGHAGTFHGRKGAAPLGRRYFLANWEMDKNVWGNGLVTFQMGPFVDTGSIADSSGLFGSQEWLWDLGVQGKIRVLNRLTIVLSYGRDLRGGNSVFYGNVLH